MVVDPPVDGGSVGGRGEVVVVASGGISGVVLLPSLTAEISSSKYVIMTFSLKRVTSLTLWCHTDEAVLCSSSDIVPLAAIDVHLDDRFTSISVWFASCPIEVVRSVTVLPRPTVCKSTE